VVSPAEKG